MSPLADDFLPMEAWDKRDEPVLLLVDYSEGDNPLMDALVAITIGHNNDHNLPDDEKQGWLFAGWNWSHDEYVQGKGTPIGWSPLPHHLAKQQEYSRHGELPAVGTAEALTPEVEAKRLYEKESHEATGSLEFPALKWEELSSQTQAKYIEMVKS